MSDAMPPPDAPVLALDAASDAASIAVVRGDIVLSDHRWTIAATPSEELLAAVDHALTAAAITRTDLAGLVVVTGPGGYSGLRAAVATAQGLAFGLGVPLAGIGRLDAEAARHLDGTSDTPIVAVHDAGRSGIAWAAFDPTAPVLPALLTPRLDDPDALATAAPRPARWCGDLTERLRLALAEAGRDAELPSGDTTPAGADAAPSRALAAARLARLRSAFGDPAAVDVVYLRPPSITRPRRTA